MLKEIGVKKLTSNLIFFGGGGGGGLELGNYRLDSYLYDCIIINTNRRVLGNHFATTYEGFLKTNKSLFITTMLLRA